MKGEVKLLRELKKNKKCWGVGGGGVGSSWGGQGGCERRSEAFVKIQKKKKKNVGVWLGRVMVVGSGQGGCERSIDRFFYFSLGGWGGGSPIRCSGGGR